MSFTVTKHELIMPWLHLKVKYIQYRGCKLRGKTSCFSSLCRVLDQPWIPTKCCQLNARGWVHCIARMYIRKRWHWSSLRKTWSTGDKYQHYHEVQPPAPCFSLLLSMHVKTFRLSRRNCLTTMLLLVPWPPLPAALHRLSSTASLPSLSGSTLDQEVTWWLHGYVRQLSFHFWM